MDQGVGKLSILARRKLKKSVLELPLTDLKEALEECKSPPKYQSHPKLDIRISCTQIYPNIWIGDGPAGGNKELLNRSGISHIINTVSSQIENYFPLEFDYLSLELRDNVAFSFLFQLSLALNFIHKAINEKGSVLIQCVKGISRSSTIGIGYLIWKKEISPDEALELVKIKAPHIEPNFGFLCQLKLWYKLLISKHITPRALIQHQGFFDFKTFENIEEVEASLKGNQFGIIVIEKQIIIFVNKAGNLEEKGDQITEITENGLKMANLLQIGAPEIYLNITSLIIEEKTDISALLHEVLSS